MLMQPWPNNEEDLRKACESAGVRPEHHCCLEMAFAISQPTLTPHQGPNRIVDWIDSWNEYRIPVPYDGYSSTLIWHCPWGGRRLPESRQTEWYDTLHSMGYTDPSEQDLPEEFNSDRWWRERDT